MGQQTEESSEGFSSSSNQPNPKKKSKISQPDIAESLQSCKVCKKKFKNLAQHLRQKQDCKYGYSSESTDESTSSNESEPSKKVESTKKLNQCKVCKKVFKSLAQHIRQNPDCKILNESTDESTTSNAPGPSRKTKTPKKSKQCKVCKKSFKSLAQHLRQKPDCDKYYTIEEKETMKAKTSQCRSFEHKIMFGPDFICICCHRELFKRTVVEVSDKFMDDLKNSNLINCIKKETNLYMDEKLWICKTCNNWLQNKKKMPPLCFLNGLDVTPIPEPMQDLTSIEKQLLQKSLVFLKLRPLPKTRMPSFYDRVINIPIADDELIKNVTELPRSATELGTVVVKLKRNMKLKTYHNFSKVRPKKINDSLKHLQKYHEQYKNISVHKLNESSELIDIENDCTSDVNMESRDERTPMDEDIDAILDPEEESDEEDNIYNFSTCILPEEPASNVIVNSTKNPIKKRLKKDGPVLEIAPGQSGHPENWLKNPYFDITAFPVLHSDGKYGLNYDRNSKLTPHQYFSQRILNHNPQFQMDPDYLFIAEQYCTRYALENKINISTKQGSLEKGSKDSYKLKPNTDIMNIFVDIPGSPSYWRKFRNEIFAHIEQKGPFHLFFTLSCAEMKWLDVYASILRKKFNSNICCEIIDGIAVWTIEENGEWRNLEDYVNEKIKNKSNFFRDHYIRITRIFDNRLKAFLSQVCIFDHSLIELCIQLSTMFNQNNPILHFR